MGAGLQRARAAARATRKPKIEVTEEMIDLGMKGWAKEAEYGGGYQQPGETATAFQRRIVRGILTGALQSETIS